MIAISERPSCPPCWLGLLISAKWIVLFYVWAGAAGTPLFPVSMVRVNTFKVQRANSWICTPRRILAPDPGLPLPMDDTAAGDASPTTRLSIARISSERCRHTPNMSADTGILQEQLSATAVIRSACRPKMHLP